MVGINLLFSLKKNLNDFNLQTKFNAKQNYNIEVIKVWVLLTFFHDNKSIKTLVDKKNTVALFQLYLSWKIIYSIFDCYLS